MKVAAAVAKVIPLAEAIHAYWEAELPKRHPHYPLVEPGADDGPPPPQEKQLRRLLSRMSEDTVYKLALIMRIGRSGEPADVSAEYHSLRVDFPAATEMIAQLMGQALLADYLREGMAVLKAEGIDLDRTEVTHARAVR